MSKQSLTLSLMRVGRLQGNVYNPMELRETVIEVEELYEDLGGATLENSGKILEKMRLPNPQVHFQVEPQLLPLIVFEPSFGWGVLHSQDSLGGWVIDFFDPETSSSFEHVVDKPDNFYLAKISLARKFTVSQSKVFNLVKDELLAQRKVLIESSAGSIAIN